jgi:hypothetical protein
MSDPQRKSATIVVPNLNENDHQVLHQLNNYTLTPKEIIVLQLAARDVARTTLYGVLIGAGLTAFITTKRRWNLGPRVITSVGIIDLCFMK